MPVCLSIRGKTIFINRTTMKHIKNPIKESRMENEKELEEKFISDDGISSVELPVTPEGGSVAKRKADVKKAVHPKAEKIAEEYDEEDEDEDEDEDMKESFAKLFDGESLSEDFRSKASLVFEAAVNEAVSKKVSGLVENIERDFESRLVEAVDESIGNIVENLDSYLDYVVKEWMTENEIAIESGIRVEMAESFMRGLKGLFYEHNVSIDEEAIDVVSELEEKLEENTKKANALANRNIALAEEVKSLKADKIFNEVCEGLTTSQAERLRTLSERLSREDAGSYKNDLETLKESFFKKTTPMISESVDEEQEIINESTAPKRVSDYDSVNAIVAAINARNLR
jgi:hypothetical protein